MNCQLNVNLPSVCLVLQYCFWHRKLIVATSRKLFPKLQGFLVLEVAILTSGPIASQPIVKPEKALWAMTIFFAPCCSSPLQFDLQAQEISAFMMQNEIATTAQSVNHCSKWSILGDFFLTATFASRYIGPLPKCTSYTTYSINCGLQ